MSCHLVAYLYCDGNFKGCVCQEYDSGGNPAGFSEASCGNSTFSTIRQYKRYVQSLGWIFRGHKAFCPNCKHGEKDDNTD